jgi:hypothetical protein
METWRDDMSRTMQADLAAKNRRCQCVDCKTRYSVEEGDRYVFEPGPVRMEAPTSLVDCKPRRVFEPGPVRHELDALVDALHRLGNGNGVLPVTAEARKATPVATGVLDYFPRALAEVARCSKVGNDQHHPGSPLHWDKSKSTDEADCLIRHFLERGTLDTDGVRHSAKVAWRALALLERELDAAQADTVAPPRLPHRANAATDGR